MIAKKIIILITVFLLTGCGFKPIYSTNKTNFAITDIELFGENKISQKIKNQLKNYQSTKNKNKFYNIKIHSDKTKNILTKDSKGNPKILEIKITVELIRMENGEVKYKRDFIENFNYNNSSNKFDLNQYEKTIEKNLIDKIVERITLFLHSL